MEGFGVKCKNSPRKFPLQSEQLARQRGTRYSFPAPIFCVLKNREYVHQEYCQRYSGSKDSMNTITIDLSPETYKRLEAQAHRIGQAPETLGRKLLEAALQAVEIKQPRTAREILRAAGRTRSLSPTLHDKIIPGVTLDEVRTILSQAAGPSLSEIINEQRGVKS